MSLYTPTHFIGTDTDAQALMHGHPFATLITSADGEQHVTHLPLLWQEDGAHGVLLGHMARANPHWQAFAGGATVAVFHGPHAYISPDWYVNPAREVPTWNYAVVHAHGLPQFIEAADEKLALIDRTTAEFEHGKAAPWTRSVDGERLQKMLGAIVAFRIPLARIEAKFKMNQNRTAGDRVRVIGKLREAAHPDLQAMAQWMEDHERS
ncbi:MAG: FMN-binding negative transcriptional regulator [Stenotrophobium sp.]